jgi:ankyrin repeat protein
VPETIAEDRSFRSTQSQRRLVAPVTDPVHQEFSRAAKEGQGIARLRYPLDRGANIDSRDSFNRTGLYHAASKGNHGAVEFLLQNGADVNLQDDIMGTPLCVAASKAHERVVEVLLDHNANVAGSYGKALGSATHGACFGGSVTIFKSVLAKGGSLTNMSTVSVPVLSEMAKERWSPSNKILSLILRGHFIKCSPILLAADRCHFDVLRLVWRGNLSDLALAENITSAPIQSPDEACWTLSEGTITSLFQTSQSSANQSYNFAPNSSRLSNTSSKASSSSAWSFMGFLPPHAIQPSSTLLMWAAGSLNLDLINYLLDSSASVDREDSSGNTSLHYTASPFEGATFGDVGECVRRLVESASHRTVYNSLWDGSAYKAPLLLAKDKEHAALDPRVQHTWGSDIHDRCVAAFVDNMTSVSHRSAVSHEASFRALSHGVLDLDTFERLYEPDAALCETDQDTETHTITAPKKARPCYHEHNALHEAQENRAPAPIVAISLKHACGLNGQGCHHCTPINYGVESSSSSSSNDPNYSYEMEDIR